MSLQTEHRLRAALLAKADGVIEGMLRAPQLADRAAELDHDGGLSHLDLPAREAIYPKRTGRRLRPLLTGAAAIAVIAAMILLALAIVSRPAGRQPVNPATRTAGPTASSRPTEPVRYLGQGKTGSRGQVPWAVVGAGWRLLQPLRADGMPTSSLYLYDPADGRYLITDRLPAGGRLLAWSPDGARALVQSPTAFNQIMLRTGTVVTTAAIPNSVFRSYTPQGLAMIVSTQIGSNDNEFRRYAMTGQLQQRYPNTGPDGVDTNGPSLYTDDGTELVVPSTAGTALLITDAGNLVRRYPAPSGVFQCTPLKPWGDGFLEACLGAGGGPVLYVQSFAGGAPRLLAEKHATDDSGFSIAWPLSNGDVLLQTVNSCGDGGNSVLHPDGTLTDLRLPPGVTAPTHIANMDNDVATLDPTAASSCASSGTGPPGLIDYNVVTGQTIPLTTGPVEIVDYPSDRG